METIHISPFPPWTNPVSKVFNLGIPKKKAVELVQSQIDKEMRANTLMVFTDGSLIPGTGAGAAAAALNCPFSDSVKIPSHRLISNYEAELIGIGLAIRLVKRIIWSAWPGKFTRVAIFSDNQGALIRTADPMLPSPGQHLYADIFSSLCSLGIPVSLYWCPGHEGIAANEQADKLAKSEAQHPEGDKSYAGLSRSIPPSLSKKKQVCSSMWDKGPLLSTEERKRYRFRLDSCSVISALDEQAKGLTATILQLQADHAPLNHFLFKIKQVLDPRCNVCFERETAPHFLMFCKKYRSLRRTLKQKLKQAKCGININSFHAIMDNPKAFPAVVDFILASNRFPNIKTYDSIKDDKMT